MSMPTRLPEPPMSHLSQHSHGQVVCRWDGGLLVSRSRNAGTQVGVKQKFRSGGCALRYVAAENANGVGSPQVLVHLPGGCAFRLFCVLSLGALYSGVSRPCRANVFVRRV